MSDDKVVQLVSVKPRRDVLESEYQKSVEDYMTMAAAMEISDIGAYMIKQRHFTNVSVAVGVMAAQKHLWDILKQYMKAINATRDLLELTPYPEDAVEFANSLLGDERDYNDKQKNLWHAQTNLKAKQTLFDEIGEGKDIQFLMTKLSTMTDSETKKFMDIATTDKDDNA